MYVGPINNTNFQANVNLTQVKTNKVRWKDIGRLVEEMTKNHPNGEINILERDGKILIEACSNKKNGWTNMLKASIKDSKFNFLLIQENNSSIASKISKLFNLGLTTEKDLKEADYFAKKMTEKVLTNTEKDFVYDHFYGESYALIRNEILRETFSDNILKNWNITI